MVTYVKVGNYVPVGRGEPEAVFERTIERHITRGSALIIIDIERKLLLLLDFRIGKVLEFFMTIKLCFVLLNSNR